jgi:hypothetical protein
MSREQRIKRYSVGYFWEPILRNRFSEMNVEFEEIVFIEELIPYSMYSAYIRIKSHSKKDEFIETTVSFNKHGVPSLSIQSNIINSVLDYIDGGKVLLNNIRSHI